MPHVVRSWLGLAAIGAGLVHLGVASRAALPVLVLLALAGAAEVCWGIATLARTTVPAVRPALVAALLAVAGWVVALLVAAADGAHAAHTGHAAESPGAALAGGALLDLLAGVGLAVVVRRGQDRTAPEPRPAVMLLGTAAGAVVVATIAANALGAVFTGGMSMH